MKSRYGETQDYPWLEYVEGSLTTIVKLYLVSRGRLNMGLNCARGSTKWKKVEIRGTWILGYLGFMNDVGMKKGYWMPQPRVTWSALLGKRRSSGVMTKREVNAGNKGFLQLPNK
jgi:hypothetical protein